MQSQNRYEFPRGAARISRVCELISTSPATVWRRVKTDPTFPQPFKLSPGVTAWDEVEIFEWLEAKKLAGRAGA